jgi:CRP-like cAMP-binding protein
VTSPLVKALSGFATLSFDDEQALARLGRNAVQFVAQRRDLVRDGASCGGVRLILEGWACRYKCLPDGRRQTLGFLIPGDLCDPGLYLLGRMDHGIGAITPVRFAEISRGQMEVLAARSSRLAEALASSVLVTAAIQREWILSIGRRNAREQIAHLLAELFHRLTAIGRAHAAGCEFPLTQNDLADATGLTAVHVNRVLKELRRDDVIHVDHRSLTIPDLAALERVGLFDPAYLHLGGHGRSNGVDLGHSWESETNRLKSQLMFAYERNGVRP